MGKSTTEQGIMAEGMNGKENMRQRKSKCISKSMQERERASRERGKELVEGGRRRNKCMQVKEKLQNSRKK